MCEFHQNYGEKIRKKIFWLGENLSFSILKFSKSVLLGDFRNDLTFDHARGWWEINFLIYGTTHRVL